jgi:capsular polysaccharide biosynthesis protein
VDGELQDLEAKKTTVEALSRQRSLAEQSFLSATKVFEERKNAESIERRRSANVRVVETAVPAQKPLPIFGIIVAGGIAMSMLVGILAAVVGDHFRRTFISSERLEREIGVPVLAAVRLTDDLGALARVAGPTGFHDRGVPSVTEPIQP